MAIRPVGFPAGLAVVAPRDPGDGALPPLGDAGFLGVVGSLGAALRRRLRAVATPRSQANNSNGDLKHCRNSLAGHNLWSSSRGNAPIFAKTRLALQTTGLLASENSMAALP